MKLWRKCLLQASVKQIGLTPGCSMRTIASWSQIPSFDKMVSVTEAAFDSLDGSPSKIWELRKDQ
jgi:hypothetical protein